MNGQSYNVLFLCTGNSARSIMAEAILNRLGRGQFRAFSAGSRPKGGVHPRALAQLQHAGFPIDHCRSKSWNEFASPDAPVLNFVFTLCDSAAQEVCPTWPGQPITAHWGIPDPAAVEGSEEKQVQAFNVAFLQLQTRIALFLALPIASIDKMSLQNQVRQIGATKD